MAPQFYWKPLSAESTESFYDSMEEAPEEGLELGVSLEEVDWIQNNILGLLGKSSSVESVPDFSPEFKILDAFTKEDISDGIRKVLHPRQARFEI